jgi:saxitoxin biosynthesis operon SxtJ-like protein
MKTKFHHENEVTNAQAKKTAVVVATVLILIAAWNIYRGRWPVVIVFSSISFVLLIIGLFVPVAAKGFHRLWMGIAGVLGYINSRILLTILYYLLFTPYGLVSRLVGRDPLDRRSPQKESYWIKRENTRQTREQFERLF